MPLLEGGSVEQSLAAARRVVHLAERLGFHRYWVAELRGVPSIPSAATWGLASCCPTTVRSTVRSALARFAEQTEADEAIVGGRTYEAEQRMRSYERLAKAWTASR